MTFYAPSSSSSFLSSLTGNNVNNNSNADGYANGVGYGVDRAADHSATAQPLGLSADNMQNYNDVFVENLLHAHEDRFCTYSKANIFVTTFNVNGKSPPESLYEWLSLDTANLPDVIVIGLQEMDLALGTYVIDNSSRQDEWLFVLRRNLPNIYKQIAYVRLIGIFLVMYRREDAAVDVSDVQHGVIATGFLKFGNKGGVGLSVRINDSLVCFINSHLAAGSHEVSKRNQDFREISQMRFGPSGIYDHEVVFWLGDLNYRLNTLAYDDVVRECNSERFPSLFRFDQLKEQQRLRTTFNGFQEATPSFRPTYKFDVGTSNWDTSEKRRVPAWCDRILYWTRDRSARVEQRAYRSVERVTFSDHKPVCTTFYLTVKRIDAKRRNAVYEEVLRESDKRANDLLPQISLSRTEFNFGDISSLEPSVGILIIKNTGLTPTRFVFTSTHQGRDMPEDWLTITPKSSFIDVGAEVEVTIQGYVQNDVPKLPESCELSCILVLSLDKGRDYFVVVSAHYSRHRPLGRSESAVELHSPVATDSSEKIVGVPAHGPHGPKTGGELYRQPPAKDNRDDWLIDL